MKLSTSGVLLGLVSPGEWEWDRIPRLKPERSSPKNKSPSERSFRRTLTARPPVRLRAVNKAPGNVNKSSRNRHPAVTRAKYVVAQE
jgi:hypothetical protein